MHQDVESIMRVKEIANQMKDPQRVAEILLHSSNLNPDPIIQWKLDSNFNDLVLMDEFPGLIILFAELDHLFPNEKWDNTVHAYILKMKEMIEAKGIASLSIFGGVAGIAFALDRASKGRTRYQTMVERLNEQILKLMDEYYFSPLQDNFRFSRPSAISLYDLIQGIVGIGVYCLNQLHHSAFKMLVEDIVSHLIELCKPLKANGYMVPGWFVSMELQFTQEDQKKFPNGNFNLGIAHGITGVLAFLSVVLLKGVEVSGQREAMRQIIVWLQNQRQEHEEVLFWGSFVSFEEEILKPTKKQSPSINKSAWCYGTAGVARTLFLAGKALECHEMKSFAVESFCSIFVQNQKEWNLTGPIFCHGLAGLLMTTWMMYKDTNLPILHKQSALLKKMLHEEFHSDFPFGYKNYEPCSKGGGVEVTNVSLIEGVSGILLTLLSLEGLMTWWHAPFLIGEGK